MTVNRKEKERQLQRNLETYQQIPARINLAHGWSAVICLPKLRKYRGDFLRCGGETESNWSHPAVLQQSARRSDAVEAVSVQRSKINCTHAADDFLKQDERLRQFETRW